MKLTIASILLLTIILQGAFFLGGCRPPAPQTGIEGKWRSADGSYVVEFLPTGNCSARYNLHRRELGGNCTYTVDKDEITLHYPDAVAQGGSPNATAVWHYTLAGDVLTVSVFGNSMTLQRVH
ncbi:MAG: hypothetical protein WAK91_05985 [Candidatus Acidiferrales bacterium]|jgi:hypothetical protein